MTYFVNDTVLDQPLTYLKNNCTKVVVCATYPTTYADATTNNGTGTGKMLADVVVDSTDITLGDGASGGRQATMAAQSSIVLDASGDADHLAWLDVTNTTILAVTQLNPTQSGLVAGNTINIPAHSIRLLDAVVAS